MTTLPLMARAIDLIYDDRMGNTRQKLAQLRVSGTVAPSTMRKWSAPRRVAPPAWRPA